MRVRAGVAFLFATLTQVKYPAWNEDARSAVQRLYHSWRLLVNGRHFRAGFRERFAGGLRSVETTWSPAGAEREHGGTVAFDGFHAHLHVMLEVREGVDAAEAAGWLQRAWVSCSPDADAAAQVVRRARFDDAHQLVKYVTKPLEDYSETPDVVRALFAGLHGLRLLQAFGSWVARDGEPGWRPKLEREQSPAPRRGPEVGELLRVVSRPIEGSTGRVAFQGVECSDVVWVDAGQAWAAVEAAFRARIAARPPPVVSSVACHSDSRDKSTDASAPCS